LQPEHSETFAPVQAEHSEEHAEKQNGILIYTQLILLKSLPFTPMFMNPECDYVYVNG